MKHVEILRNPLWVGAAQTDITPPVPVEKGGSFRSFLAAEVLSPLTAQAVAWGEGNSAVIWASCDLGSVDEDLVVEFRRLVSTETGVDCNRIHLSATHNHGAPTSPVFSIYRDDALEQKVRATYSGIIRKAAAAATQAYLNRRPARMGIGEGRAERACFNRRFIMSNGRACMHGITSDGVVRLQVEGPVDDALKVVWFEDAKTGEHIVILVQFTTHPGQMYGIQALGSDYPGVMRETLCRALGRNIPILFLQGACGNIQPVDMENDPTWGAGLEGIRLIGNLLAGETLKILHSFRTKETAGLHLAYVSGEVDLQLRSFPQEEIIRTLQILEDGRRTNEPRIFFDRHFAALDQKARAKAIALTNFLRKKGPTERLRLEGIRLGDALFITTPAHQFVEYQIALKRMFPNENVILVDLTNGNANYVPTRLAIALGGYETEHRRYEPDAGERILATSISMVTQLLAG